MNKRELVLSLLDPGQAPEYTPAAFFLHFDPEYHRGQAAIDKHLEFFRYTGMDFVKIQYEHRGSQPEISRPEDWARLPRYDEAFFADPLAVVEGLVKAAKKEALVLVTLYSPLMWASRIAGDEQLIRHAHDNLGLFQQGMEAITDSVRTFVRACIRLGVDGFYASTQGGERHRFADLSLFDACVRPYDLAIMEEIDEACIFNILHVCDYQGDYDDLTRFREYPGHVVNSPLQVGDQRLTPQEVASLFNRPYMGGMKRMGVIATGTPEEVRTAAESILQEAPERFILAADCTVSSETPWDNLRTAIETAHHHL